MRLALRSLVLIVVMSGIALVWWGNRPQMRPILVLAEGQSNMVQFLPYTWTIDYNRQLADAVNRDGNAFFAPIDDLPENLFDPVNGKIHLLATGYEQAGKLVFRTWQKQRSEQGFLWWLASFAR